jgi:hypothetical protein
VLRMLLISDPSYPVAAVLVLFSPDIPLPVICRLQAANELPRISNSKSATLLKAIQSIKAISE